MAINVYNKKRYGQGQDQKIFKKRGKVQCSKLGCFKKKKKMQKIWPTITAQLIRNKSLKIFTTTLNIMTSKWLKIISIIK